MEVIKGKVKVYKEGKDNTKILLATKENYINPKLLKPEVANVIMQTLAGSSTFYGIKSTNSWQSAKGHCLVLSDYKGAINTEDRFILGENRLVSFDRPKEIINNPYLTGKDVTNYRDKTLNDNIIIAHKFEEGEGTFYSVYTGHALMRKSSFYGFSKATFPEDEGFFTQEDMGKFYSEGQFIRKNGDVLFITGHLPTENPRDYYPSISVNLIVLDSDLNYKTRIIPPTERSGNMFYETMNFVRTFNKESDRFIALSSFVSKSVVSLKSVQFGIDGVTKISENELKIEDEEKLKQSMFIPIELLHAKGKLYALGCYVEPADIYWQISSTESIQKIVDYQEEKIKKIALVEYDADSFKVLKELYSIDPATLLNNKGKPSAAVCGHAKIFAYDEKKNEMWINNTILNLDTLEETQIPGFWDEDGDGKNASINGELYKGNFLSLFLMKTPKHSSHLQMQVGWYKPYNLVSRVLLDEPITKKADETIIVEYEFQLNLPEKAEPQFLKHLKKNNALTDY